MNKVAFKILFESFKKAMDNIGVETCLKWREIIQKKIDDYFEEMYKKLINMSGMIEDSMEEKYESTRNIPLPRCKSIIRY